MARAKKKAPPRVPTVKARNEVARMLDKVAAQVTALPAPALARMAPVLAAAEKEVTRELRAELRKHRGNATFTAQVHRNTLVAVKRARHAIAAIEPTLATGLRAASRAAGQLAVEVVQKDLARFSQLFQGSIVAPSIDEAATIARGDRLMLRRHAKSARRYGRAVRADLVRELAISRARGESIDQATNRLMKRMPKLFDGHRWKAERLVRTETMHAYNVVQRDAILEMNRQDPSVLARWDSSLDRRSCKECRALDGTVVDISAGREFKASWKEAKQGPRRAVMRTRRVSRDQPPAHPNCRCVLTPWRREWGDPPRTVEPDPTSRSARTATARKAARDLGVKKQAAGTGG